MTSPFEGVKMEERNSSELMFQGQEFHDYHTSFGFPTQKLEKSCSPVKNNGTKGRGGGRIVQSRSLYDLNRMDHGKTPKKEHANVMFPESLMNLPANIKNTYINKIKNLLRQHPAEFNQLTQNLDVANPKELEVIKTKTVAHPSMKKSRSQLMKPDVSVSPENVKLERNRQSARKSRRRKKVYIDMLESKVEMLNSQLNEAYGLLEQNTGGLEEIYLNSTVLSHLKEEPTAFINQLKQSEEAEDEVAISQLLDSYRHLLEANRSGRPNLADQMYCQFTDVIVPLQVKFFMSLLKGQNLHKPTPETAAYDEILKAVPEFEKCKAMMQLNQKLLEMKKADVNTVINSMEDSKKELLQRMGTFQGLMDEISGSLSPVQISKLILFLDKFRTGDDKLQKQLSAAMMSRGKLFPMEEVFGGISVGITAPPIMVDINRTFDLFVRTKQFLKKRKHQEMVEP
eukprot:TRINITY_DN17351_c0_g1_i1.p1 TRINITY_DN17351_c0_g1~~TRINITY_DN17351_c0_g1_i1.p1  ORF type:complete len:455 (+),score=102.75 TRINITY_DN17351_c0_g1_i1:450-1814(+)